MRSTHLLTFLVTLALVVAPAQQCIAQEHVTKLDVKTPFIVKKSNQHLKAGVIAALKASPLYATVETGEDYSLWITHASKRPVDSRRYELVVVLELRTPARIRHGKLIASKEVVVVYDPTAEAWTTLTMQPYLPVATTSSLLIKMLGPLTMARAAGMLLPFGRVPVAAISWFVSASIRSLTVFSVNEQMEGLPLGSKCVEAIDAMVEGAGR